MKKLLFLVACATACVVTTGCNYYFWQKSVSASAAAGVDTANDPVLLKIDGKPMLRKGEFLEFVEQAIKANPYLSQFGISSYENAPEPIRQQLLDAVVQQKLIAVWGQAHGLDKTAQYKESYEKLAEQLRQALIAQAFEKEIFETIQVSDAEVREEFDRSRDRMIKDPGSVKAVAVSFASEEKANIFYDLVAKKEEATFNNLAKELSVDPVDLGLISLDPRTGPSATVPAAVKRALIDLAEDEYYVQAKDGDIFWVVQVTDRIKPTYFEFNEVAQEVAAQVRHEKFKVVREARVNELKTGHTVDIDKSSLGAGQDPFAMLQQLLAAQGGAAGAANFLNDGDESEDMATLASDDENQEAVQGEKSL
jgi:hypothetical protein